MSEQSPFSEFLIWAWVMNLGIAFGAGVYEHRIVLPRWLKRDAAGAHWDAKSALADDTGRKFWGMVTTLPLTSLTLICLYEAWHAGEAIRSGWLASALLALADRVFTFAYFIPTMMRLMKQPDSPAAVAQAERWRGLNHLRHAIVLAAWFLALRTFAGFCRGG